MPSNVIPPSWSVIHDPVEHVPDPNFGTAAAGPGFVRSTYRVVNSVGQLVAASGDRQDAINQALSVAQQTQQPYSSETWNHA